MKIIKKKINKTSDRVIDIRFNIKKVSDEKNLLAILKSTSMDVPIRTGGRKTEHVEKWSICHLLATLVPTKALVYPLSLQHIDKPDFILEMNKNQYGIEITESIPPDYAKCCAMAEKINPDAVIDMSLFKWDSPKKSTKEIIEIISRSELSGEGWTGDSAEVEWANYIQGAISTKLDKLNNAGYKELPEYWLSIYDNLPLPKVNATKATDILISEFSKEWKGNRVFTHVFIEMGQIMIDISGNTPTEHDILDLWSNK